MIRYLAVATVLVLLAACGETTPTRWPTTTPVSTTGSTAASEAESTEVPDTGSGEPPTVVPADEPRDSGVAESVTPESIGASSGEESSGSKSEEEVVITESGLQIEDLVVGTGEQPRTDAIVVVHYTGWLLDGTKFDIGGPGGAL